MYHLLVTIVQAEEFKPLIERAFAAFRTDFRYAEHIAKQWGILQNRRELKLSKESASGVRQLDDSGV